MPRDALSERLTQLLGERRISAFGASRAAGLSENYVRALQRGKHRPSFRVLAALARALGLDEETHAELRRLAGIDPDPAATPEAQRARREAWRPLTYILVNHVLLPRIQLDALLQRKRPLRDPDKALMRRAAAAPDMASFVHEAAELPAPSRTITRLLEKTFHAVQPDDITWLQRKVAEAITSREGFGLGRTHAEPYRWNERWAVALTLLSFNRPKRSEVELFEYMHRWAYDYNFAACLFPAVYWHACRAWPFEKTVMPFARIAPGAQRRLYDAVQAGLPLIESDNALLGRGALGEELAAQAAARPSPENVSQAGRADWVEIPLQTGARRVTKISGRRPPIDAVFDHLDRCELLDRFPIIKIDRTGAAELARALDLPSWAAWTEYIGRRMVTSTGAPSGIWTDDVPPLSAERFASVLWKVRERKASSDDEYTIASHVGRRIIRETADALARRLGDGDWRSIGAAARSLDLPQSWQRIIDAFASHADKSDHAT